MTTTRNARRTLTGTVKSAKSAQTITVEVERTYKHPKYGKYVRKKKKYMAHDAQGAAKPGDKVEIEATRPISKLKRWRLIRVIGVADGAEMTVAENPEALARAEAQVNEGNDQ